MERREEDLQLSIYKARPFSGGCLEIRLFYVRIVPCAVESLPEHLILRHLRREVGVCLDINGARLPSSDEVSITLRRDRVDRDSREVTYVSTDSVKISGSIEFEVCEDGKDSDLILCGSLDRADSSAPWSNGNTSDDCSRTGWIMDCYAATVDNRSKLFQSGVWISSPSIEVYVAGCCSHVPVILTKMISVSPRKKMLGQGMLDAIPEDEELGKVQRNLSNGLIRQIKLPFDSDDDDDESGRKVATRYYYNSEDMMYKYDEDGQLSWFNAGVRVGVGIGLGMCLGVGIGVGLLMRSYQATTRNFRRRFL